MLSQVSEMLPSLPEVSQTPRDTLPHPEPAVSKVNGLISSKCCSRHLGKPRDDHFDPDNPGQPGSHSPFLSQVMGSMQAPNWLRSPPRLEAGQ